MVWSGDTILYLSPIAKDNPPYYLLTVKCKRFILGICAMEKRISTRALSMNKLYNSHVFHSIFLRYWIWHWETFYKQHAGQMLIRYFLLSQKKNSYIAKQKLQKGKANRGKQVKVIINRVRPTFSEISC